MPGMAKLQCPTTKRHGALSQSCPVGPMSRSWAGVLLKGFMLGSHSFNVVLSLSSAPMAVTMHPSRDCPSQHSPNQRFSTCGSRPLVGGGMSNNSFTEVSYQMSCISDIYITIRNSSKITVKYQ